ncbi:MAG: hypothetical protein BWY42_00644 [Candidatus Omnitrophica bacterium ADurb.Bin277]|nr:MAG: hypothetical protein BWY42_00644 [Candidatus Omnitrophica bacterium ADurb.Bin277]
MKILRNILILALVVIAGLVLGRNIIVKTAIEKGAGIAVGLPASIQKLDIGLGKSHLDIRGLEVGNPEGFGDSLMVNMPRIYADYHLTNILKGRLHMEKIELDLNQFTVVRGKDGKLNINSIKGLDQGKPAAEAPGAPKKEAKTMPMQLDTVRLKIGKVVYIDMSGNRPVTREFNIGLDETFHNITEPGTMVRLIVLRVMTRTPLAVLTNFDLGNLQSSVGGIVGTASDLAAQTASKGLDTLKSAASIAGDAQDTVKDAASSVTGGVKSVTSGITSRIKNPFGSGE